MVNEQAGGIGDSAIEHSDTHALVPHSVNRGDGWFMEGDEL